MIAHTFSCSPEYCRPRHCCECLHPPRVLKPRHPPLRRSRGDRGARVSGDRHSLPRRPGPGPTGPSSPTARRPHKDYRQKFLRGGSRGDFEHFCHFRHFCILIFCGTFFPPRWNFSFLIHSRSIELFRLEDDLLIFSRIGSVPNHPMDPSASSGPRRPTGRLPDEFRPNLRPNPRPQPALCWRVGSWVIFFSAFWV